MGMWGKVKRALGMSRRETTGGDSRRAVTHVRSASTVTQLDGAADPSWTFTFLQSSGRPMSTIEASIWVGSCTRAIASRVGSVRLAVRVNGELAPLHPLQALLEAPAPGWTRARLLEDMAYNLQLTGSSYLEKRASIANGGAPAELWSWGEGPITTSMESQGSPVASHYRKNTSAMAGTLALEQVIRTLNVRPGEFDRGLSPAEPAEHEISIDRQATGWQECAFGNRGVPDGIFASTEYLEDEQYADAEERLADKWQGIANAHRPMLIGQDVKWMALSRSMVELEMIKGREFTRSAICAAFGVAEVIFSASGATFANLETGETITWGTVANLLDSIVDAINTQLAPDYGEGVTVEALIGEARSRGIPQDRRWLGAVPAINGGVPWNQISRIFDLGLDPWDGWDVPRVGTEPAPTENNGQPRPKLEIVQ